VFVSHREATEQFKDVTNCLHSYVYGPGYFFSVRVVHPRQVLACYRHSVLEKFRGKHYWSHCNIRPVTVMQDCLQLVLNWCQSLSRPVMCRGEKQIRDFQKQPLRYFDRTTVIVWCRFIGLWRNSWEIIV